MNTSALAVAAAVSGQNIVYMVVILAIVAIVWITLDYFQLPPPINKIARIIVVVVGVLVLCNILLALAGHPLW